MPTTIAAPKTKRAPATEKDFLPLEGTDHIEFYVGNAKQAAHFYQSALGFQPLAYSGPETGVRDRASYVARQNKITFVLTTPLRANHPVAEHHHKHGDGVKVIALKVKDATSAWKETTKRGGKSYMEPKTSKDEQGKIVVSGIHTYGEVVHMFVERDDYTGPFMPGFVRWDPPFRAPETGLQHVDHCVGNVGWGKMNPWVKFYEEVMGFRNILTFDDKDISTEYSALMSKVMSNGNGFVKFPINEPAEGKKKSQVEEYLDFYDGEGVQHIAMATNNIIETISALQQRGLEFLKVPSTYYDTLLDRVGHIDEELNALKQLGTLGDRANEGYLLQILSKSRQALLPLLCQIIKRKGAKSFGKGNFKALFEAIEREQAARGNL